MEFPNIDQLRAQVVKVTDRETKAFVVGVPGGDATGWALHTLAEHFRAALMGVTPDESQWPADHVQVLADLEKIADAYDVNHGYTGKAPQYPYGT